MLDQTTKRKLDSARQILVGKVPDPKAQVEQITTALVYKFMDDMDKESEELGGEAKFFANGFSQYAWTKLLDNKLSGQERLDLYVQAITNMSKNPHIPQLFRDIFKGAFLPYNDPRTLSLFLKEINEFNYEHSENLGNAFEYLLSILGSQGDAGQFRTPRHIIDFIVEVVDPKKNETILDPACGTAGFLISAYKHILKQNKEKALTPDEKLKLMNNLAGYDISPDMVRLSKVNMYLHGFPSPTIFEYDTLSSEEKWDENFDIMLANPPFMTPKGGIKPHKRFSVQANRAEVLFVDYILEHLRPNGRAGIIVPEGIIFQSATAYKSLRKLLVKDGLLAVVSLPAGVFNPYAGVKTSILLFDNYLAKKTNDILFLKIENDGFNLGAQRREIDKNDLPLALEIIKKYKEALRGNKKYSLSANQSKIAYLVGREKIAQNGEYNLTGDRYKEIINFANQKWPIVELKEVSDISSGNSAPQNKELFKNGEYPFFRTSDVGAVHISDDLITSRDKLNEAGAKGLKLLPKNTILFPKSGASTFLNHRAMLGVDGYVSSHLATIVPNENKILPKFLFNLLKNIDAKTLTSEQNYPSLKTSEIAKIKIPLPPLEIQKDIVEQIEVKQKAIEAAKAVVDNLERERRYFGQSLRKIEGVEWVKFNKVAHCLTPPAKIQKNYFGMFGEYPIIDQSQKEISGWSNDKNVVVRIDKPVVIFGDHTCAIKYVDKPFIQGADGIKIIVVNDRIIPKFLYYYLRTGVIKMDGYKRHYSKLKEIEIPILSMEIQKNLILGMEEQEKIIGANKKLIEIMEKKIDEVLNKI